MRSTAIVSRFARRASRLVGGVTMVGLGLFAWSPSASADPSGGEGAVTLRTITIFGRPPRPSVVVELTRPTAARAAAVAHEDMKNAWLERSVPATLRAGR